MSLKVNRCKSNLWFLCEWDYNALIVVIYLFNYHVATFWSLRLHDSYDAKTLFFSLFFHHAYDVNLTLFHMNKITPYSAWLGSLTSFMLVHTYILGYWRKTKSHGQTVRQHTSLCRTPYAGKESSIFYDITYHVTGGFLCKLMMYACARQVYVCVNIVQRDFAAELFQDFNPLHAEA